jgi:hypothetical protein
VVGERVSLADLSLFAAYRAVLGLKAADASLLPSLFRWFMTVASLPAVKAVVGTSSPVAPTLALVQPGAGKWGRGRVRVKELLQRDTAAIGEQVVLKGWIRTARSAEKGAMLFVELTDGSTVRGVQLVFNATSRGMQAVADAGGAGASLSIKGAVVASIARGQTIEVLISEATVLGAVYGGDNGEVGGKNYPMSKKQHGLEFLREKAHLRPRSKVFSSALRVRHAMAYATNKVTHQC